MEVEFSGLQAMVDKLKSAGVNMRGEPVYKALAKGGEVIEAAMVERAPMRLDDRTSGSWSLEPGALKAGMRVAFISEDGVTEALIGPNEEVQRVARWVEYGHRQVHGGYSKVLPSGLTRGPGKAGEDVPAYPFLRPAFEASVNEAMEVVDVSLKESFKEILS